MTTPAPEQPTRRRTLKIIVGGAILAIAAVVAGTWRIFTGSPETASTTTTTGSKVASTTVTMSSAASTTVTMSSAASTTSTMSPAASTTGPLAWPRLKAINAKSLEPLKALWFYYPLVGTPNFLVKLGVKADNGIGPDGDIVAFSAICQHQGCGFNFAPPTFRTSAITTVNLPPGGSCGCHGSYYDFVHNGAVIGGPAPYPVPRVLLEYDQSTGDIYAIGMGPPTIYGQGPSGTTDPAEILKYDLQGQIVTQITVTPA